MKKLSLRAMELGATGALSRAQLKNVLGGTGTISGSYKCCGGYGSGNVHCSDCVTVKDGQTASCSVGQLTAC